MNDTNWLDVVPSIASAVATFAAAIAAIGSFRVSRQANRVAEQSSLAIHHGSAANTLTAAISSVTKWSGPFGDAAYNVWAQWPRDIEALDNRDAGGADPRPLRHVLVDAGDMLLAHASEGGARYSRAGISMFSIVRDGIGNMSDEEYERLLRKADGRYEHFPAVFGAPHVTKDITASPAFRWAYYQLTKRVSTTNWSNVWTSAWSEGSYLAKYRAEHERFKPILESVQDSLKAEQDRLAHTTFPLDSNPSLKAKYDSVADAVDVLIEGCGLDLFDGYLEHPHWDDLVPLIIYSMGIALLATKLIENVTEFKR